MKYLHEGRKMMTSQPSPGEFLSKYEEFHKEGFTHVFVVTLSEKISGTYQSAVIAKSMVDFPLEISINAPKVASFGVALGIPLMIKAIQEGITFANLQKRYESIYANGHVMFTLSNLMHLFRGGRLSKVSALLGTVLRIKPIVEMVDGKLQLTKKERTNNACYDHFFEKVKEYTEKYSKVYVDIVELNRKEWGDKLASAISEKFPNVILNQSHAVSPVFLVHLGDQGFGIAILGE
jgi:DegV family protein with EDD domain